MVHLEGWMNIQQLYQSQFDWAPFGNFLGHHLDLVALTLLLFANALHRVHAAARSGDSLHHSTTINIEGEATG